MVMKIKSWLPLKTNKLSIDNESMDGDIIPLSEIMSDVFIGKTYDTRHNLLVEEKGEFENEQP
jgi:hypothetical protein